MARTDPEVPGPPEHLSQRTQILWRGIVPRRAISPERLALLQVALEALDRADAARQVITQEGMVTTTKTTGAVHVHPLVKVEREALGVFTRCWRALGLTWSMELDGRMRGSGLG